ncbi:hypothetical protein Droror1_Dr00012106, partial [Drosera rotundifolia]
MSAMAAWSGTAMGSMVRRGDGQRAEELETSARADCVLASHLRSSGQQPLNVRPAMLGHPAAGPAGLDSVLVGSIGPVWLGLGPDSGPNLNTQQSSVIWH